MKSGSYRRAAYFLLACFVLLTAACSDKESDATSTYPYKRDGILLTLPEEWEVIEDDLHAPGRRTIVVVTDVGSFATIDIYHTVFYDEPLPTLEEYSKRYLQLTMNDEEAQAKAQIDSGEVNRGDSKGVFLT